MSAAWECWVIIILPRLGKHFEADKQNGRDFAEDIIHDDVIKWKHFPRYWPFVRGMHRSPVNSPHKGQWRGALMFTLIGSRINGWVSNREAGDLRRHRAHYDVTVMQMQFREWKSLITPQNPIEIDSFGSGWQFVNIFLAEVLISLVLNRWLANIWNDHEPNYRRICVSSSLTHDDVIKWAHFPRYWSFVREIHRWITHKGQWRGVLMFFFS